MIVQQVEMMKEMVNAFSEYARPPRMQRTRVQLNELIDELLDLYRAGNGGLTLLGELDPQLPPLEAADPVRLRQLLHNILKNSVEALEGHEHGELQVSTRLGSESGGDYAELRVTDNGPGIDPSVRDRLFEPYMTTKPKGTGLGLAIVRKVVEDHGGMIEAQESGSGGTTIIIRLPLNGAPEPADEGRADPAVGRANRQP